MIDVKRYMRLKGKGYSRVNGCNLEFALFNVETGEKLDPETQLIIKEDLVKRIEELKIELEGCEEILKLYK